MIELLLQAGGDPELKTKEHERPYDVAKDDAGSPLLEHTIVYSNARKSGIIRAKDELLSHARCPETIRRAAMPRFLPMLVEPRRWRAYDEGGFLRLRAVAMRTHGCALQMEAFRNARGIEGLSLIHI